MSWKLRVLVSALLFAPAASMGLGLGEIRLGSALNEPLNAEIDLVAATPEELSALEAQLASPEIFQRYGLDRPAYLNTIEFRVGRGQDGRSVLLVRSREAIGEPFVSFLVDVNWSRGRLLREYTVLLDPPALAPVAASPPAPVSAPTTLSPAPRPATPAPTTPAAPAGMESEYRVERGDTLYGIAGTLTGGDRQATQQMMIGLFRANPGAFEGNVNRLRAGAILRVPGAGEIGGIAPAEAAAEIRRHHESWRAAGGGESGRLRLVTPPEDAADAGTADAQTSGTVRSQIDSLRQDIAEQQRLLQLRNEELAKLQGELARARAAEEAAARAAAEAAAQPPPPEAEAPVEDGETAVAPEDDVGREAPPAPAEAPVEEPRERPAPSAAEKGLLERLTENWTIPAGIVGVLLLGLLGYGFVRRRREAGGAPAAYRGLDVPATAPVPTETMRLRALATGDETAELERPATLEETTDPMVVEERPVARPRAAPQPAPRPSAGHEETISAEAALDLDQADPLAEADFHMAYGLYDQAVDLVRMALKNQPERNDLKLKLAEIHFVAGDTPQFLNVARDLRKTLGPGADWDRIVIMGRQLAPDEGMFAGGVQDAGVDLSLEGGDNLVDLDLLSAPEGDEGIDLDFGTTTATEEATGENTAIEFNLDDAAGAHTSTQEIAKKDGQGTVEMPTLELPSSETPTVETPTLKLRGKGGAVPTDSTAEMAIDDLGLDLGGVDGLPDEDDATSIEDVGADDPTQIAPHDERTRLMALGKDEDDDGTAVLPAGEGGDTGATGVMPKFELDAVDFDLGGSESSDTAATARNRMTTEQLPQLSELEPVTMSEVGTKLDLARAYMDMGDPDGARNILQEVLAEGSASQKQEARRLIDSLPGA